MFDYRQVLTRMRLGDSDRAIACVALMGRRKLAQLRRTPGPAGWLGVATPPPGARELGVHLGSVRTQPAAASLAEPHRQPPTGQDWLWWSISDGAVCLLAASSADTIEAFPRRTSPPRNTRAQEIHPIKNTIPLDSAGAELLPIRQALHRVVSKLYNRTTSPALLYNIKNLPHCPIERNELPAPVHS